MRSTGSHTSSIYNAACSHNQRDLDWPGGCTRQRHKLTMHQCNRTNWEMSYYRGDRSEASTGARHGAGAVQLQGGLLIRSLKSRTPGASQNLRWIRSLKSRTPIRAFPSDTAAFVQGHRIIQCYCLKVVLFGAQYCFFIIVLSGDGSLATTDDLVFARLPLCRAISPHARSAVFFFYLSRVISLKSDAFVVKFYKSLVLYSSVLFCFLLQYNK
jgi:hypothetical protein